MLSYAKSGIWEPYCARQNVFARTSWSIWACGCTSWSTVGGVAHVQPSAWEVDFDCWECSHMPKLIFGSLIVRAKCVCTDKLEHVHAVALRGARGGVAHVQPSAWGVGFDCWECSHMPKVIFGSLIVRGKMCLYGQVGAWACGGTSWAVGGGTCSTKCMGS
ncbi:hypothetical protein FNV43_RR21518 [Rhamnella rubrinervis]|uniref:Uncharacterized protein n=1 Tax=Rhamnella rubrinervis TaxID=2594499 RepID=A0A8K0E3A1_9ROSA|nr:hypothetical protein FNV43_RR21518 [Rhamnella rubrinervis]